MSEDTETPKPADVAGRIDGLVRLLPCPFCGERAEIIPLQGAFEGYSLKVVRCCGCGATTNVDTWNKRQSNG